MITDSPAGDSPVEAAVSVAAWDSVLAAEAGVRGEDAAAVAAEAADGNLLQVKLLLTKGGVDNAWI